MRVTRVQDKSVPNYTGPVILVVGLKCPSPFDKIVQLFCILLARTITKQAVAWVGSGLCNRNVPFHWSPEFLLNRKHFERGLAILLQTANCGLPLMVSVHVIRLL